MKKRIIPLILLLIIILPTINAAPPVLSSGKTVGYDIEALVTDAKIINTQQKFHVHVYNSTSGFPITTGIGCYLHLYNNTGSHVVKLYDDTVSDGFDYEFVVTETNFTVKGEYLYVAQCNNSNLGGFVTGSFILNERGNEYTLAEATTGTTTIILFFLLSITLLVFGVYTTKSNSYWYFGLLLIGFGIIIMFYTVLTNVEVTKAVLSVDLGTKTDTIVGKMFIGLRAISYLIIVAFLIWAVNFIKDLFERKKPSADGWDYNNPKQ